MNFSTDKNAFEETLQAAARFSPTGGSLGTPIQGAKIDVRKDTIFITTTNLSDFYTSQIKATTQKEGSVVVDQKKIIEFITLLSPGNINVLIEEGSVIIEQGKSKGYFNTYPIDDFPKPPTIESKGVDIPKEVLLNISKTLMVASKDETRPVLTGVFIDMKKEGGNVVCTDGFRLSLTPIKIEGALPPIILPASVLQEAIKTIKGEDGLNFVISEEQKVIKITSGETEIYSRIIDGDFPPYEKVIPKTTETQARVNRQDFIKALRLISVFARENADIVIMDLSKNGLYIRPKTPKNKESQAFLQTEEVSGPSIKIAFNYKYIIDFLNNTSSDEVVVGFGSATSPGVFKDPTNEEHVHIIMPLRTEETSE